MVFKLSTLLESIGVKGAGNPMLLLLARDCSHTFGIDSVKKSTTLVDSFGI